MQIPFGFYLTINLFTGRNIYVLMVAFKLFFYVLIN